MNISHDHTRPPRALPRTLRRLALVERLTKALNGQLVLIRAPAGYGKTDLMAAVYERLRQREATAWLTLGPNDGPGQVAAVIASAIGMAEQEPAQVLDALHRRRTPVFVFLDAAERAQHRRDLLDWLLIDPPSSLCLALAGRALPRIRASTLRLRGLLQDITPDELAFSRDEMRQLLTLRLAPPEQEILMELLGAWPALVSLAALILDSDPTPFARAQLMEGRHPLLRDFLMEEALASVGPVGMALLRACAELPDFTFDIAADLAGLPQDEATLAAFEDLSPLVVSEVQQIGWYRMHPLVARIIPLMEAAEGEAIRRARHIQAATLFAERGLLEKSVMHACMGADYALAVETIERAGGVEVFLRVGYTVLRSIVNAVPHDVVRQTPSLRLCRGLMLAKTGRIQEARAIVDTLREETRTGLIPTAQNWSGVLEHISSLIDVYADTALDDEGIAELVRRAGQERPENTWRLGWLFNHLAIAHTRRGDFQSAQRCASNALAYYQEERSSYPQAFMLIHLAFVNLQANRIEAVLGYSQQAEAIIRSRQWNDTNLIAIAHVPLAAALYRQGQVARAEQLLERSMPVLAQGEGWVDFYVQGYVTLARARMTSGGWEAADTVAQEALAVARARDLPRLQLSITILRAELLTKAGLLDVAESVAHPLVGAAKWPTERERNEAAVALARLHLRQGRNEAARLLLDQVAAATRGTEFSAIRLRAELLSLELGCATDDTEAALAALQQAALLSAPGEQRQQFHDEGRHLSQQVRALTRRVGLRRMTRETADYLSRTAAFPTSGGDSAFLSGRELEILILLDEALTNKAIARRLGVTEATVKFHLKNLYAKLGVGRRQLALQVAKRAGLLALPPEAKARGQSPSGR